MEPISTGLTWGQLEEYFLTDPDFNLELNYSARRANPRLRKNGLTNEKFVWRLIFQRTLPWKTTTLYRKNLKGVEENIEVAVVPDVIINRINELMGLPWTI